MDPLNLRGKFWNPGKFRTMSETGRVRPERKMKKHKLNSSDCSSQSYSASSSYPHSRAEPPPSSFSEPVAPRTPSSSLPATGCGSGEGNRSSHSNSASRSYPHSRAKPTLIRKFSSRWVGMTHSAGERHSKCRDTFY